MSVIWHVDSNLLTATTPMMLDAGHLPAQDPFDNVHASLKQQLDARQCWRALKADELFAVMSPWTDPRGRGGREARNNFDHRNKLRSYTQVDHAMRCVACLQPNTSAAQHSTPRHPLVGPLLCMLVYQCNSSSSRQEMTVDRESTQLQVVICFLYILCQVCSPVQCIEREGECCHAICTSFACKDHLPSCFCH